MDAQQLRRRKILLSGFVLIAACAVGGMFLKALRDVRQAEKQPGGKFDLSSIKLPKPPTPSQGFVGSDACAECHAEIAAKYARHPMSRSLKLLADAEPLEDYGADGVEFQPPGNRRYRVEKQGDDVVHHEILLDETGEKIYDQSVNVRFVLGSGQHGRSYLIDRGGVLYQSSIGWFRDGGRWDLSPGYRPSLHQRFERRVGNGCLYCHTGRVDMLDDGSERYSPKVFQEMSIGCERCHGPGERHVRQQQAARLTGRDDSIVNPGRLEPSKREAVCNQCHIQGEKTVTRFGRGFFDFRPGDHLEETMIVMLHGERIDDEHKTRPVSQVEQMRSSQCFKQSSGKFGCISCHDPHEPSPKDSPAAAAQYYRDRCFRCHDDKSCSAPAAEQAAAPANGSCIHCHMPALATTGVAHTSLTDHRVRRRPDAAPVSTGRVLPTELEFFDGSAERLPPRELERARGIAMADLAAATQDQTWAGRAEEVLVPAFSQELSLRQVLESIDDDIPVLEALGSVYQQTSRPDLAAICWEYALQQHPKNEALLARLSFLYLDNKNWDDALPHLDGALKINPHSSILHGRRAFVLGNLDRVEEGIAAARKALEFDPTMTQVREWLIGSYRRIGDREAAEREMLELKRIKRVLNTEDGSR